MPIYFEVRINAEQLQSLRMLADWQLRERGYDPISVNEACRQYDEKILGKDS